MCRLWRAIMSIQNDVREIKNILSGMSESLVQINAGIQRLVACICEGKAVDLSIVLGQQPPTTSKGSAPMANKKASGPGVKVQCFAPKGGKKAVMPDVTITDPAPKSIALQAIDSSGNVVVLQPTDSVTGTLTSDSPSLTIGAGADTLNYVGTIPANTPFGSVANLTATMTGTIQGSPANFTASVKVTINIPPSPVAVDLIITIG